MDSIPLILLFGILALLLILSGLFSGSETALMTLNRYRLRHRVQEGHQGAYYAERLLKTPDRLIGLILLGNNFVNILASSLVTLIAIRLGGEGAIPAAAGLLTLAILIFSEVAPKTLAALHPEKLAYPAAWVYTPLLRILFPVVWVVNLIANAILKLLNVQTETNQQHALTREELRTVVNEASSLISKQYKNMLLGILDLEKISVDEIMVPRTELDGIDLEQPIDIILHQLKQLPYTRVLVYRNNIDNVLGTIHSRRVLQAYLEANALTHETLEQLIHQPYFIPKGTPLHQQLRNFQINKRRYGLVVDEYGDVLGLITIADVIEEVVGEFTTDPADSISDIRPQTDGSYLVDGTANLRELARNIPWDLPKNGPKTLNGLIIEHLQSLPENGISIKISGYSIEVLQIQDNRVKTAHITPITN